ncbi:MAG: hypothetical protein JW855_01860 [Gammaproteobacteria bacterium]|nr:hypothetical protein [Gammaproteobacteria bacterium]
MLKKIFLGGIANIIWLITIICVGLTQSAIVVRYLTSYDAGIWFVFLSIGTVFTYCDFGMQPTLSREIGFAYKKINIQDRVCNLFRTINWLTIYIILSLVVLTSIVLPIYYFFISHFSKTILLAFLFFSLGALIRLKANPYLAVIYGFRHIGIERLIRSLALILGVIFAFLFLLLHYGLIGLSLAWCIQNLSLYVISRIFITYKSLLIKKGYFLPLIVKRIVNPCFQWFLTSFGALFIFQIPNFFLAKILGPSVVPQYSLLYQIISAIISFSIILQTITIPFISKLYGMRKFKKVRQFLIFNTKYGVAIAISLSLFVWFNIQNIMYIWTSNRIPLDQPTLFILLITCVLEVQHVTAAQTAMASGYVKFAKPSIISGVINLILCAPFIKYLGVTGAALSITISQLLTNNWYSVLISLRFLKIPLKEFLFQSALRNMIYLLLGYLVSLIWYFFFFIKNPYYALIINIIYTTICFSILIFLILFSRKEKYFFIKFLKIWLKKGFKINKDKYAY